MAMMRPDPTHCLTEAQLACLRLVARGPSKVIAKILGISPHTVDNHLKAAMQRLGASTRHEAAEIVARHDAARASRRADDGAYDQDLASQSWDLADAGNPAIFGEPWRSPMADRGANRLHEMRVSLEDFGDTNGVFLPSAPGKGQPNGRSPLQIIAFVAVLTVAIAITASAALPISQGFQALSNLIQPYH